MRARGALFAFVGVLALALILASCHRTLNVESAETDNIATAISSLSDSVRQLGNPSSETPGSINLPDVSQSLRDISAQMGAIASALATREPQPPPPPITPNVTVEIPVDMTPIAAVLESVSDALESLATAILASDIDEQPDRASRVPLITLLAGIAAAVITGLSSYLHTLVARYQKISEFRQAWIDGLRSDIAKAAAAANVVAWHNEEGAEPLSHQILLDGSTAANAVVLRINPAETNTKAKEMNERLLAALEKVREISNVTNYEALKADVKTLAAASQEVLKFEWDRVKSGEPKFHLTLWSVIGVMVASLLVIAFSVSNALS